MKPSGKMRLREEREKKRKFLKKYLKKRKMFVFPKEMEAVKCKENKHGSNLMKIRSIKKNEMDFE